jgi:hypothetical protein
MIRAARRSSQGLPLVIAALVLLAACGAHSAAAGASGHSPTETDATTAVPHSSTTTITWTNAGSAGDAPNAAVITTAPTSDATTSPASNPDVTIPASSNPDLAATDVATTMPSVTAPSSSVDSSGAAESATTDTGVPGAATRVADATGTTSPVPVKSGANVNADEDVGDPISISIPSIGVESVLVPTGVLADGTMAVPVDPKIAGWFTGGPRPGEKGPAVIMGHVDQKIAGPGVFWHLRDLQIGAEVIIHTTTRDITFVAVERDLIAKNKFPTEQVYGPVPTPALRLITCGGSFDRSIGHYRSNVVVYLVPKASS